MKLTLRPLVVGLSLAALSAAALAQQGPSVEVFGQVGVAVSQRNHQTATDGSITDVGTGPLNGSYLGFRGREDLGNGLTALFRLESSLAPDSGLVGKNAGSYFDRFSYVGLSGGWGTVFMGRMLNAATERGTLTNDVYSLAGTNAHVLPLALIGADRYNANDTRISNAIKYRYGAGRGLQWGVSYGFGEVTGSTEKGSNIAADLAHVTDSYNIGAGYVQFRAPAALATTGAIPKNTVWFVGGSVTLGAFKPYLNYYNSAIDSTATVATANAGLRQQQNKIWNAALAWKASPTTTVKASWFNDKGTTLNGVAGRDGAKNTLVTSVEYALSRRTNLFATMANNSLSAGYLLDTAYLAALGRNPTASSVQYYSMGVSTRF